MVMLISLFLSLTAFCKSAETLPLFLQYKTDAWVSQKLAKMSLEEKIAQLMTIAIYPEQGELSRTKSLEQIKLYKPGGIMVMQGSPVETAKWINRFQQQSKIPLLVAVDAEWGLAMRTDSVMRFPYAQAIGAIQDSVLVYEMGRSVARQLKTMGIHIDFAPVADINTNPENPVINFRSFGENKLNVAQKCWWMAKGMQDEHIIAVAKHFPGHGNTNADSHEMLPVLNQTKAKLDTFETYPFRYLSEHGIIGIMTAHLNVLSIDASGTPSSLSKKNVSDYLKSEIGFTGIVITDAINMKGVRTERNNSEAEALIAGNDMLTYVPDLKKAIDAVKAAINKGQLTTIQIDEKCLKILALKRWVGLQNYAPVDLNQITKRLNSANFEVVNRKLIKGALTVLKNNSVLPIEGLDTLKIASLIIGDNEITPFQRMLEKYTSVDHFFVAKNATEQDWAKIKLKLESYNLVIAGIQGIHLYPRTKFGITEIQQKIVTEIVQKQRTILAFFGNAYALKYFENIEKSAGLVVAYQNNDLTQELAAQLIFGAFGATGKLPVTVEKFKSGDGITTKANQCFAYTIPEELGIDGELLNRNIDSLANLGINKKAFPGCQVIVAKNGQVILQKSYGYHTYDKQIKVRDNDLYDWASITKVTGPLPALMKLVDENKIDIEKPLSDYWPDFKNSNKQNILFSEFLTHQSGLPAWLPLWQMAASKKGVLNPNYFKHNPENDYRVRVSENLYLRDDFKKNIFDTIRNSKLGEKKYLYSDLSFLIYPEIITKLTGSDYVEYLDKSFYRSLGANTITYNPYLKFTLNQIVPTETDIIFRKQTIHGFVHDESAAMLGGISGNAGLFGSANDLAKIFEMYLQKGFFGGKRYISEETMKRFTTTRFPENGNRRALGFDKPFLTQNTYPTKEVSAKSFGHSGFTGTFVWADPENGILFVFLSNRVYPTRENENIFNLNIRPAMLENIYNCVGTSTP